MNQRILKLILAYIVLFVWLKSDLYAQKAMFISANDAKRKMPLSEAVQAGCVGVSVRVKLTNEGRFECSGRLFEHEYLKPALKMDFNGNPFVIILQLDGDSMQMAGALDKLLAPYADLLSKQVGKEEVKGKLKVYVWGDVPSKRLKSANDNFCSYFTLAMMDKKQAQGDFSAHAFGMIFESLYSWNGRESMPNMQYHGMQMNLKAARKAGQNTFMFEAPETFNAWNILSHAGVQYFIVKDLDKARRFLLED
jgi:hypothetical protein